MNAIGGTIKLLRSEEEKGTEFKFSFPYQSVRKVMLRQIKDYHTQSATACNVPFEDPISNLGKKLPKTNQKKFWHLQGSEALGIMRVMENLGVLG